MSSSVNTRASADKVLTQKEISPAPFIPRAAQRAEVVLGQPKARCRYHGICRIDSPGFPSPKGCQGQVVAGILTWYAPELCLLAIPRGQLSLFREQYHFGKGKIWLHRQQELSQFWDIAQHKKRLMSGFYTVKYLSQRYEIRLRVK